MFACNLMDTVMNHTTIEKVAITMQACKLADFEIWSDYENAKHVVI